MKSYASLIIAFLIGAFVVSAGWGGALYAALKLVGLVTLVVLGALVWTSLDKRKPQACEPPKPTSRPGRPTV